MPDILSYFTQKCGKSFVSEYLPIANSYKEYNPDKNILYNHMEKVMSQEISCGDCFHRSSRNTQMLYTSNVPKILLGKTFQQDFPQAL